MTAKLILHIPHSSTRIPLKEGYLVDAVSLDQEILKLTDWYTDDLFHSAEDEMIRADFSRIFCDVERFADDSREVMAQVGMGVLYERSDDGETIRNVTPASREQILLEYYWKHHAKLSNAVNKQLKHFGKAWILDCHSFPSTPLKRDLDQNPDRPDFNIGTDAWHTSKKLLNLAVSFFKDSGYTVGINWPYRGSIVPMEHYRKNKHVETIMLEINRGLYLEEPGNEKSDRYSEIKTMTGEFIKMIKKQAI